jgi:hypothetical protein
MQNCIPLIQTSELFNSVYGRLVYNNKQYTFFSKYNINNQQQQQNNNNNNNNNTKFNTEQKCQIVNKYSLQLG